MDFPLYFQKCDLTDVGSNFWQKKNSEKAKHPQICLSLGGSMPEAQIKQCPLTPSPTLKRPITPANPAPPHYGLWHPANKMTKITNFASIGPIELKIGQRSRFLPEITHTKFQLSSLNV